MKAKKSTKNKTLLDAQLLFQINGCILITTIIDKGQYTLCEFLCYCGQKDCKTFKNFRNTPKCNYNNHKELVAKKEKLAKENETEFEIIPSDKPTPFLKITNPEVYTKPSEIHSRKWSLERLKLTLDEMYGEAMFLLDKINCDIVHKAAFLLQCAICTYVWYTNLSEVVFSNKGCPWCKDECANIKNFDLYTVAFIGSKIHKNRYTYSLVNNEPITNSSCKVSIWCNILNHLPVIMTVLEHLIRRKAGKIHCCEECERKRIADKPFKQPVEWKNNLEYFLKKAYKKHGFGTYDYSQIKREDILFISSAVPIICLRDKTGNGDICKHKFYQRIYEHVVCGTRCPDCFKKVKMTLSKFIERSTAKYGNKFSYHLIKEEDVEDIFSKPKISCSFCQFILTDTAINYFLNNKLKQCPRCENHMKWTSERLKEECEKKKIEGFNYDKIKFDKLDNIDCDTTIIVTCTICVDKYSISDFFPTINNHFNNKSGCPRCSGTMPWNYERFLSDIPKLFKDTFDYSSVRPEMITSALSEIPIIHKECNVEFKRTIYDHMIKMLGCSFCAKSQMEQTVFMILAKLEIPFKDEYRIAGLDGTDYRYDFLYYYNNKHGIIEVDGGGHFEVIEMFGGEERFLEGRKRDIYKHYCALMKGIKIIRIDHKIPLSRFEAIILEAINSDVQEYFATPTMYDWLIEGVKNYQK